MILQIKKLDTKAIRSLARGMHMFDKTDPDLYEMFLDTLKEYSELKNFTNFEFSKHSPS